MYNEIPNYGLRAYALFFSRHGLHEQFGQSDLDWIVGQSMKKKIFSLLLNAGWIKKTSANAYKCINPEQILKGLLEFKVAQIIKESKKPYAFTGLSAIEIWSDYSYVQRGREKSPYYIKILKKDLRYWKAFFNSNRIPNYVDKGSTVGEFIILIPVKKLKFVEKEGIMVETLKETEKIAKANSFYVYPYNYMKEKYKNHGTITA
ncbi:MAG: hypothetical protein COT61_04315 [Candidatus Portnoybacteria bacterium CG09_land_8_20_14_0_10_44_13]|uniref:Uncharacterized protein n=1 Tax=Candidatus Portnoybacteria bacterium CG09_land_8_20_14_0_10_44_13 TaxID=1974811 RepID=A0A2H0WWS4_9BACT|nr:MAG: hypothetical protein COT61_04315 [Candidatus Portnoybacteria bacterium CG09_land_8_20_14_0_10_44_13]